MGLEIPRALLDAGGWVFAAVILSAVITALIRGDLVPGGVHKREIARADQATDQLERNSETNEKVVSQVAVLIDLLGKLLVLRSTG